MSDLALRHLSGKHNQDSHGNDVGVDVIPGDKLKGAGRIDLEPGERLLRSDRLRGEHGRAWLAVTELDGKRSLRIGLGNATFGTRHDHGGPWRAGPDRTAEINEERAELRAQIEDLENEIEDLEGDPDADPVRLAELRAQLEEMYSADSDVGELPGGYTANLDEISARRLREALAKALDDGEKLQAELDEPYRELDRLTLERDKLKRRAFGRKFTDEEDAEWDRLTAEIARAEAELDPSSGPERPESGYWTLAEGSIPGQWADVHYDIFLDDPDVGVEVKLGAVPHGSDMDFEDLSGNEMAAYFDAAEADEFVKLLGKMVSGDQPKPVNAPSTAPSGRSDNKEGGVERSIKPNRATNTRRARTTSPARTHLGLCTRAFDFELDSPGDGRTLEGYAAVFNRSARISDLQGDFDEIIRPGAFTRSLERRTPVLQWDHGKDPRIGTAPIGDIHELREDDHGLYVRARLYDHPDIERVRLAIKGKSVRGMSFRFGVPNGGDKWSHRSGDVDLREIREADTHELGPVVFPAYDATSVSVRSILSGLDPAEIRELVHELSEHLRSAVDLTDLTGRPSARRAGGGDLDGRKPSTNPLSVRFAADGDSLRLRGIL